MVGFAGEAQSFDGNGSAIRTATRRRLAARQLRQNESRRQAVVGNATRSRWARARCIRPRSRRTARRALLPAAAARRQRAAGGPGTAPASKQTPTPQRCRSERPTAAAPRRRPATRRRPRREERDPQAPARLHRDHRARPDRRLRRPLHARPPALDLPGWVPVLGTDFFELKGEFATAQAITPGQGQTVDIAGVEVGQITKVDLVERARDRDDGDQAEVRAPRCNPNATMLLRPKTGLKDMIVELDPGTRPAGRPVRDGYTVPVSNTQPDVNLDEILAVLDRDTRTTCSCCSTARRRAWRATAATSRRSSAASSRPRATRRSSRSCSRSGASTSAARSTTSASSRTRSPRATSSSRRSSTARTQVFKRFANQDANLQRTIALLPAALRDTNRALAQAKAFADQAGPALGGAAARAPARSGRRSSRRGRSCARRRRSSATSCGRSREWRRRS